MCSFQENRVNIFTLCSRPYRYVLMIHFRFSRICVLYIYHSRLLYVVMYALSILYSAMHCILILSPHYCIVFSSLGLIFSFRSHRIQSYLLTMHH